MSVDVVRGDDPTRCTWTFQCTNNANSNGFFAPIGSNTEWLLSFGTGRKGCIGLELLSSEIALPVTTSVSLRLATEQNGETRIVNEQKAKFSIGNKRLYYTQKTLTFEKKIVVTCELRFDKMELVKNMNFVGHDSEPFIENEHLSDVTLEFANKRLLRAHKIILAANSAYFAEMFERDAEKKVTHILINEISEEVALEMIRFIYTKKVSLEKYAMGLFVAADHYELKDKDLLKDMWEVKHSVNLTVENAVEKLLFADKHSASYLKTMSIEFINSNKQVMTEDSWVEIPPHFYKKFIRI